MKLKHGAYVFFTVTNRKRKGRISIGENGRYYLCQDCLSNNGIVGIEAFGHESVYSLGSSPYDHIFYIKQFSLTPATKKAWTAFIEIPDKNVVGWGFAKEKGRSKNPLYVFGCGAVKVTRSQILSFIEERDNYVKFINSRIETNRKMDELRKEISNNENAFNVWQSSNSECMAVVSALGSRAIKPERVNTERLKLLFK